MTGIEIRELCKKLENHYIEGGYVSRATIFNKALNDGLITRDILDEAKKYYSSLWTYVGD